MGRVCIVKGCPRKKKLGQKYSFHRLPSREAEIKQWLEVIELRSEISSSSQICSLHFDDECFIKCGDTTRLVPGSMPLPYKVIQYIAK